MQAENKNLHTVIVIVAVLFRAIIGGGAPVCLTCNEPDSCRYVTASFSSNYLYYILGCRGPDIPVYTLRERLNENAGQILILWLTPATVDIALFQPDARIMTNLWQMFFFCQR